MDIWERHATLIVNGCRPIKKKDLPLNFVNLRDGQLATKESSTKQRYEGKEEGAQRWRFSIIIFPNGRAD